MAGLAAEWLLAAASLLLRLGLAQGQQDGEWSTIVSFNVGLPSETFPPAFYEERRKALLASLNSTGSEATAGIAGSFENPVWKNADVVCLQEIFAQDVRQDVVALAGQAGFGHNYSVGALEASPLDGAAAACSLMFLREAQACANSTCSLTLQDDPSALLLCFLTDCRSHVEATTQTCINCLITNGFNAQKCAHPGTNAYPTNLGLLLLSKKRILHSSLRAYEEKTALIRRGYLRADIQDLGTVFCTHMFPSLDGVTAAAAINLEQMRQLVAAAAGHNSIIVGDLNTGPAIPSADVVESFPDSYAYARSQGFQSLYPEAAEASCTFCMTNPILMASSTPYNSSILDHILINKQVFRADTPKRVFVEDVTSASGEIGLRIPLSDHYGVQVRIASSAPIIMLPVHALVIASIAVTTLLFV